jgi:RNA polymerase sigma factor (sigma-70 family)
MLNICITIWRKSEKRPMKRLPIDLIDRASQPGRRAARKEARRRVSQALRLLSREERALLADKYWRGLSSAEIGVRRGLTAAQVDQKMFQIRRKLRDGLSPDDLPD